MKRNTLTLLAFFIAGASAFASTKFHMGVTAYYWNASNICTQYGIVDCVVSPAGQHCSAFVSGLGTVSLYEAGCINTLKYP